MADLSLPLTPSEKSFASSKHFALSLSAEEKSRDGLLRALCLRAFFLSLFAYCVYSAILVLATSASMLQNQWENTYPEAPHIYAAIRAVRTHRLYFPFTQAPYVLESYGPLFYEMYYWLARAVHSDLDRLIYWARLTNFASFLLCGLLLFAICRRLGFAALSCIAAATLPLGIPLFCGACITARPDMYFLAAMLVSLLAAIWTDSPGDWLCLLAGLSGGLAFLIKQPGIAVLIAIGICWLFQRKFRQTLFLSLGMAIPAVLVFGSLFLRHEDFLTQFLSVGQAVRSVPEGIRYSSSVLGNPTLLLPIALGIIGFFRAIASRQRAALIAAFTLVNWLVGLSGMPQAGSAGNYFFAGLMGCGLLLPFTIEFLRDKAKFAPILLLGAVGFCFLTGRYAIGPVQPTNFTPNAYQSLRSFHILSDRPEFPLHTNDPDLLDPISIHMVELGTGEWNSAPIEQNVRDLREDLVILACSGGSRVICNYRGVNFFGPGVINALNHNYGVFCTSRNAIVLTPRLRQVNVTPDMLAPALGAPCETRYQGHAPDLLILAGTR